MRKEGCTVDGSDKVSDDAFHADFLDNPQANALADALAIGTGIEIGLTPDEAQAFLDATEQTILAGNADRLTTEAGPSSRVALGQSAIRERQIDFILQEEFSLGTPFPQSFLETAFAMAAAPYEQKVSAVEDVRASVRDQHTEASTGETDVLVLYRTEGQKASLPRALLIENKIDAAYQPLQAKRYRLRGKRGVEVGLWSDFLTCHRRHLQELSADSRKA